MSDVNPYEAPVQPADAQQARRAPLARASISVRLTQFFFTLWAAESIYIAATRSDFVQPLVFAVVAVTLVFAVERRLPGARYLAGATIVALASVGMWLSWQRTTNFSSTQSALWPGYALLLALAQRVTFGRKSRAYFAYVEQPIEQASYGEPEPERLKRSRARKKAKRRAVQATR